VRYKHALMTAACLAAGLALAPFARPQDDGIQPYYWPNRTVGIPIAVDRLLKQQNKPSEAQLYYSLNRGPFQKGPKLSINNMQPLDGGKSGFLFTSDRDGDFEFTVQFIYPDGNVSPRIEELTPQQRIVIDTTPPQIRLSPISNGVEWIVTDENLDPRGTTLKCRWPGSRDWMAVTGHQFGPVDRFTWPVQAGKTLEVQLEAKDRAGHRSLSQIARIPLDGVIGASLPRQGTSSGNTWIGGSSNPNVPAPRVEFVNTLKFDVDYTIQHMGRSGIQAAYLFVLHNQPNWDLVKRFPFQVKLMPSDKDQTLSLPFEAKEEGTYGFYVIPESGAAKKDDAPLVWVVVDTTQPAVKITDVKVNPGTSRGPVVAITWEASDANLMPQPISLEWSLDKNAAKWNEIKYRLDNLQGSNTGRYIWEIPDENLWKFWVRIRAVDKASNTGEYIYPQEVIVDLEQPSAGIVKVRGGNSPAPNPGGYTPKSPGVSDSPSSVPKTPGGSDSPPAVPVVPSFPPSSPPSLP
jgi:hypothetical protein